MSKWTQIAEGAWVNDSKTIAIARTEAGEYVTISKDGKRIYYYDTLEDAMADPIYEDAPTNSVGSGNMAGGGNMAGYSPFLFRRKNKPFMRRRHKLRKFRDVTK